MLKFTIKTSSDFTAKELVRLEKARLLCEEICNSPEFKQKFLTADFTGETSRFQYKSNQELFQVFMEGSERLTPGVDYEADIDQGIFNPRWRSRKTIGRTWKSRTYQEINRKFFWRLSIIEVAGNIVHEWGHKLGFSHDRKRTKRRPFSICYQLNRIMEECYEEKYGKPKKKIKTKRKRKSFFKRLWPF